MPRIAVYHREDGKAYGITATLTNLWDGSGAGFKFYPNDGPAMRCKIPNGSNKIYDRDTGLEVGEYDPVDKVAVIIYEDEPIAQGVN